MINKEENPVAWFMLVTNLEEAKEHLESLIDDLVKGECVEEVDFGVYVGHIYAHLNRVWNSRNLDRQLADEEWSVFSQFPSDIRPVG